MTLVSSISAPYLSTHQHRRLFWLHWTSEYDPSAWQSGMKIPIGSRLRSLMLLKTRLRSSVHDGGAEKYYRDFKDHSRKWCLLCSDLDDGVNSSGLVVDIGK